MILSGEPKAFYENSSPLCFPEYLAKGKLRRKSVIDPKHVGSRDTWTHVSHAVKIRVVFYMNLGKRRRKLYKKSFGKKDHDHDYLSKFAHHLFPILSDFLQVLLFMEL